MGTLKMMAGWLQYLPMVVLCIAIALLAICFLKPRDPTKEQGWCQKVLGKYNEMKKPRQF